MKHLYIQCAMGAAGDMLMGALSEISASQKAFVTRVNGLGIPGINVSAVSSEKCGITGTHMEVEIFGHEEGCHNVHGDERHHHSGLSDVSHIIDHMEVSDKVKNDAKAVYKIIAEAESKVHGEPVEHIHFHEVGTLDAVADVVGNCILMDEIGADKVTVSPVHVGSGTVKCAHGVLPVPAPATALILKGIPVYSGDILGELCTPTGAALLKYFADDFGPMPAMKISAVGYGMGTKDFDQANCVRVFIGEDAGQTSEVVELAANLDDMTAEKIGFAIEMLMEGGALDAYAEPIIMKKSRPGTKLTCMCRVEDRDEMASLFFRHTTTIGIREQRFERMVLDRQTEIRTTEWGDVRVKVCSGYGVVRRKAEYDDVARIAREKGISIEEAEKEIDVQ